MKRTVYEARVAEGQHSEATASSQPLPCTLCCGTGELWYPHLKEKYPCRGEWHNGYAQGRCEAGHGAFANTAKTTEAV